MSVCSLQLGNLAGTVALPSWYALATLSRQERVVASELESRGIDAYLPTITEIHRWSDRRKKVEVPLFPGYVFMQSAMTPVVRRSAICARGVVGFVTMHGEPLPIPEEEIAGIRQLLAGEMPCAPYPFLKVGQRVRVRGGALDGIEGCLVRAEGSRKLVVSIDAISRSLALHIDGYDLEAI